MEHGAEWPAPRAALEAGRRFLERRSEPWVVLPDGDVDGLSSGALVFRALERLGRRVSVVLPGKAEHAHSDPVREAVRARAPGAVVVLDMGTRGEPILPGVATLVVDHHAPTRGTPPGAVWVGAAGHEPVAPTALLAYELLRGVRGLEVEDLAWLAALGTVADLGPDAPFPSIAAVLARAGKGNVREAVALLNAPRRSAKHELHVAWDVLAAAREPADIARGRVPGVERLQAIRVEVQREVDRCARTPPRFGGDAALLLFSSGAKVHPLVAARWAGRLAGSIVVAANTGYLPGRVNFAIRSRRDVDLLRWLHGLGVPLPADAGHGHPRATGGSVPPERFAELLVAMGFDAAAAADVPGPS